MDRTVETIPASIQELPPLMRVAAYARVSTGKDAMLHSLSAQISYYSEMIQSHTGWCFAGVYSDEAITGTKSQRQGFQKMLSDCREGNIDRIITKSISRFARNTVTLLETVRELKSLGIDVFFEEQAIHTISAEGELLLTIMASYAQEESLSASENVKWRVRQAFQRGEIYGLRRIYGYRVSEGNLEIDPQESAIVREIFRRVIDGESLNSIAADLNRRGLPSSLGKTWQVGPLSLLISNEKYTGNARLQKSYRNNHLEKKKTVNRGEMPCYYAEGTHEAIIDEETFREAQKIVQRNQQQAGKRRPRVSSPFSGLMICEECGAIYRRCTCHGIVFWNCSLYTSKGPEGCSGCRIREDTLIDLTIETADIEMIRGITVGKQRLTYQLKDGTEIEKTWQQPSRSSSWTAEMKQTASTRTRIQRRSENGTISNIHPGYNKSDDEAVPNFVKKTESRGICPRVDG